jgi:phosphoribosylformylglycinamidine synthase
VSAVPAVVLAAPGTNRDADVAAALVLAGAAPRIVPLAEVAHADVLGDARLIVIAGGFSFADALGSGRLFALELQARLGDQLEAFVAAGRPVLGICNGFQTLVRAGLLPGAGTTGGAALGHNASGRFVCRWVTLAAPPSRSIWTAGLDGPISCPVAHGEGRFTADPATLEVLRADGRIALTYANEDGSPAAGASPSNPNGSQLDIAGICDQSGVVLGLMPHPENHIHPHQHPRWVRGGQTGLALGLFAAGVRHAKELP